MDARRAAILLAVLLVVLPPPIVAGLAQADRSPHIVQLHAPLTPFERAELLARGVVLEELTVVTGGIADLAPADVDWLRSRRWVERVDPDEALELHLDRSRALVRAEPSHTRGIGPTGSGVTLAIVDGGLDSTHPDFEGRVRANLLWTGTGWREGRVDPDGHGTHVAGVAAGSGERSSGRLAGFAPEAELVFLGFGERFTTTVALRAFEWIQANKDAHGIRVVQNSWGRAETGRPFDSGDALVRASDRLVASGVVVVFSASNHGPAAGTVALEAQNPNVITVGAVDGAAVPAEFSSRGPVRFPDGREAPWVKPDLVANGVAVVAARSTLAARDPLGGLGPVLDVAPETAFYREMQGTSQAAPAVAGIAALLLEVDPNLTPRDVKRILLESAIDLGEPGPNDVTGFGLVDARDALALARGLAPDRGNVLVAGGEDVFVARGRLVAAEGRMVQLEPAPALRSDGVVETRFPVKPGATRVAFDFAWDGATRVAVWLYDGASWHGPWTREGLAPDGRRLVQGAVDAPAPGVWSLVARPASPSADLAYGTTVRVAVKECPECVSVVDPAYLDARAGAPRDTALYYAEELVEQSRAFVRRAAEAPGPERSFALLALGVLGIGVGLRVLAARPWERRAPARVEPETPAAPVPAEPPRT